MDILRPEQVNSQNMASLRFTDLTPDELKEAYARAREAFTAEDLQRYTEIDEGVSADELLLEMEETQRQFDARRSQ